MPSISKQPRSADLRAAWLVGLVALAPAASSAQYSVEPPLETPSPEAVAQARTLFLRAREAVDAGQWADALADFEASYRLSGIPAALYNTATTLRALGRHRDARDALRQLLAGEDAPADLRAQAEERLREEEARGASLELAGIPAGVAVEVSLDGASVPFDAERPLVETDAGSHALRVDADRYEPFAWRGVLSDGQRLRIEVELRLREVSVVEVPAPAPRGENLLESPWLWVIVGALAVAGVVVAAVVAQDQAQLRPTEGLIAVRL